MALQGFVPLIGWRQSAQIERDTETPHIQRQSVSESIKEMKNKKHSRVCEREPAIWYIRRTSQVVFNAGYGTSTDLAVR
jgi:hypothetical protein